MFSREKIFHVVRFGMSGAAATATDIGALAVLIYVLHLWYLAAAVIAFLIGFVVSFSLQKFWTFRDHTTERMGAQAAVYLAIVLMNLTINTFFVFVLVEYVGLTPIPAQLVASVVIACESFFLYRIVFRRPLVNDANGRGGA